MGDVVMFQRPPPRGPGPEVLAAMEAHCASMDRELRRRVLVYGASVTVDGWEQWARVIGLYPMFRLTHARRGRRCLHCDHRIAPLELHFVKDGSYVCQSGCMEKPDT
jgi:hypothetical protein